MTLVSFRLPNLQQRLSISGRTGSGKSQLGAWALSQARFDIQPFIIVDYKREELFENVERIKDLSIKDKLPSEPGLYRIRPLPGDDDAVEDWLWKVWDHEQTGLFFDEAYSLPNKGALTAIYTQGRSKRLPCITLTQRPTYINRFAISEADFYAVFHLNDDRDKKIVQNFLPKERLDLGSRLDKYCCHWYDVGQDAVFQLKPVPPAEIIVDTFNERLKPNRRKI